MTAVTIDIDRDGWTTSLQVAISTDDHGYRLAGPKYNGSGTNLARLPVTAEGAAQAVAAIDLFGPAEPSGEAVLVIVRSGPGVWRACLQHDEDIVAWLTEPAVGEVTEFRRVRLKGRDLAEVRGYLELVVSA